MNITRTLTISFDHAGATWTAEVEMFSSTDRLRMHADVRTCEDNAEVGGVFLNYLTPRIRNLTAPNAYVDGELFTLPSTLSERKEVLDLEYPFGFDFLVKLLDAYNAEVDRRMGKSRETSKSGGGGPEPDPAVTHGTLTSDPKRDVDTIVNGETAEQPDLVPVGRDGNGSGS